jgi:hypothetical protein
MTPSRRALSIAGIATLALSLAMSIGPAVGANPNSGAVKVHDASTGLEAATQGNEPWVCSFWVTFTTTDVAEAGSWQLMSWPPTGDGTVLFAGVYDTSGDGEASTDTLSPAAGHYRFEWQVTGDNNSKNKTLWVADDCTADASSPSQETSPSEEAAPSEEASPSQETSPSQEAAPSQETSPSQEAAPSQETSPSQEAAPSTEPTASPAPEQEVQHGNPPVSSPAESGVAAPATGGVVPVLPDTAIPVSESGVLATIGVMLIIAAHMGSRRKRSLPTA